MTTIRLLRSSLLASLLVAASAALNASDNTIAFPAASTPALSGSRSFADLRIALGERRESVVAKLGQPDLKLTPNGWVYQNVTLTVHGETRPALDNLVIVFLDEKVASIRVATDEIVDVLVADVQRGQPGAAVAARAQ